MSAWRPITEADTVVEANNPRHTLNKRWLVTNNLESRDSTGQMSHVWIGFIILASNPVRTGKYVTFSDGDRLIHGLTHCAEIPT